MLNQAEFEFGVFLAGIVLSVVGVWLWHLFDPRRPVVTTPVKKYFSVEVPAILEIDGHFCEMNVTCVDGRFYSDTGERLIRTMTTKKAFPAPHKGERVGLYSPSAMYWIKASDDTQATYAGDCISMKGDEGHK